MPTPDKAMMLQGMLSAAQLERERVAAPSPAPQLEQLLEQLHQRVEARADFGIRLRAESYNYTADDIRWILQQALAAATAREAILRADLDYQHKNRDQIWEQKKQLEQREQALHQLVKEIEQHCPCGARPESLSTHPHVAGCPVAALTALLPVPEPAKEPQP